MRKPFGGRPSPSGPWLGAGLAIFPSVDDSVLRLGAGWPDVFTVSDGTLGLMVPVYFDSAEALDIRAYLLAFAPGVDWEYELFNDKGRLSLSLQGGLGLTILWVELPDAPFMPGGWESDTGLLLRGAGSLRYGFPTGLFFEVQPFGFIGGVNNGDSQFDIEMAVAAGYRWW